MNNIRLLVALNVILLVSNTAAELQAKDSYLKARLNFKLTAAPKTNLDIVKSGYILGEAYYGILNNVEAGIALGTLLLPMSLKDQHQNNGAEILMGNYHPVGEMVMNFHPLPFFLTEKTPRFDIYLSTRLGGYYLTERFRNSGFYSYYQFGGGLGYYMTKNIGVYTEFNYQQNRVSLNTSGIRVGLTVKF